MKIQRWLAKALLAVYCSFLLPMGSKVKKPVSVPPLSKLMVVPA
jgi:hypothetical protein